MLQLTLARLFITFFGLFTLGNAQITFDNCPGDETINNTGAFPYAYTIPVITATVNSSGIAADVKVTSTPSYFPGIDINFGVGYVLNLEYTASANNETDVCEFSVTFLDTGDPYYPDCPTKPLVFNTNDSDMAEATWNETTPNDASAGMISESMLTKPAETSPANFPIGETNLTYTATDGSGNTGTCIITIRVIDIGDPIVTEYPNDTIIDTDSGQPTALYNWTAPVATDNSGTAVIVFYEINGMTCSSPSYEFPIGSSVVTVNVSDQSGNSVSGMFNVTVEDNEPPMIDCPTNVTSNNYIGEVFGLINVSTDIGSLNATVTWDPPVTSDNSNGTVTVVSSPFESGDMIPIGTHTITFTATDFSENNDTCKFYFEVEDVEPPNATCPSVVAGVTDPGSPNGTVSFNITVVDNVLVSHFETKYALVYPSSKTIDMVSYDFETTAVFPIGETIIEYTFYDNASPTANQESCYVTVVIKDDEEPYIINCPVKIIIVNTTTGEAFAINITWFEPSATDNSGETLVPVSDYTSGDNMFAIGNTTVQYNVSDLAGNFNDSCSFVITVGDNESPMIDCPTNVTSNNYIGEGYGLVNISTDEGSPNATVTWDPPVTSDNSNGTVTVVSSPFESGDMIPIGTHIITFTATDLSGNNDTCEFYFEVEEQLLKTYEDVEPPNATCPSVVASVTDPGNPNGTVSFNITVVDNVLVSLYEANYTLVCDYRCTIDMVSYDFETTAVFSIGETIVEYTFYDNGSPTANKESCYVTVVIKDDEEPYIINCPVKIIIVNTTTGEAFAINITWFEPSATDNSGETLVPVSDYTSGDNMFAIGNTTVQYNVSDSAGNFNDSCSFVITVGDNESPMIDCPTNVTSNNYIGEGYGLVNISTDEGSPNATVTWDPPVTSDNSNGTVTVVSSPFESGDMIPIGTHIITFTSTDPYGNSDTCVFGLKVEDNEDPVLGCPPNINTTTADGSNQAFNVNWTDPTVIDNSGANITLTSNYSSGSNVFYDGSTDVIYDAVDSSGNVATCKFTVTVTDIEPPLLINCPNDIVLATDLGLPTLNYSWIEPTATDNVDTSPMISSDIDAPYVFNISVYVITFTATDDSGNEAMCNFTLEVKGDQIVVHETK
ncbi:hyalin-like [Antedon mediterranea]|uniref:hyalin-like n=1 Tax=Antedon mediterranea TaxID=105859 RepID=UPI003AF88F10